MNRRPPLNTDEREAAKNSFRASSDRESTLHNRRAVKSAIDERLSGVRFNAQDTRAVLTAARNGKKRAQKRRKRRLFKPDAIFAFSLILIIALPLSLYAMRSRENITSIVTAPGDTTPAPVISAQPQDDPISPPPSIAPTDADGVADEKTETSSADLTESDAIRIAKACFDAQCDTTLFTADEYTVSAAYADGDEPRYSVTMESVYNNGCTFTVVVSAASGEVLQYSAPERATIPAFVDLTKPEVCAWYDKYGQSPIAWPQDVQSEFSRRYQGGTLREAREGEIDYETALAAVRDTVTSELPGRFNAFYPVLYSERASSTGRAYYLVYCYAQDVSSADDDETPMIVSFDAESGDILSIENNPLDGELSIQSIYRTKDKEKHP